MKLLVSILSILTLFLVVTGAASAAQRTTLYNFGAGFVGPITLAQDGSLYGVMNTGEVFHLSPDAPAWRKDTLYQLVDDGINFGNFSPLTLRDDGSLLGSSEGLLGPGHGNIFLLTPPGGGTPAWTKSVLHTFTGNPDGEWPIGGFTPDGQGSYLGFTDRGGSADGGTFYRLTPPVSGSNWSIQTVIDFIWSNGALPSARPVPNGKGSFYGILAGSKDIISLTPPAAGQSTWTQTLLHRYPADLWEFRWPLVVDKNGAIYGTTANKIFRLIPPTPKQTKWKSVILMSFNKKNLIPNGFGLSGVVVDANGVIYGLTSQGGSSTACGKTGCGTLFKLTPPVPGQTKYTFTVIDQQAGGNGLIVDQTGALYGTAGSSVFTVTGSGFQP